MPNSASVSEVVGQVVMERPRYVPSLRAYCAVAREFEEHGWGTFMARHARRKLQQWGEPTHGTPSPTRLVTLGLLQRVPQDRKTPQYLMLHSEEIAAALEALGLGRPAL